MNDKEILSCLKLCGWEETYTNEPYVKYYRFQVRTMSGWEYFYLDRSSSDARLCLHPRFLDWRKEFRACSGVEIGGGKNLILKSADMLDFPKGKGRTNNDIPEFFPLRFHTKDALLRALKVISDKANIIQFTVSPNDDSSLVNDPVFSKAARSEVEIPAESDPEFSRPTSDEVESKDRIKYLAIEVESAMAQMDRDYFNKPGEDIDAIVKRRLGQGPFRNLLLELYGGKCLLSGLANKRLLIASHIIPWSKVSNPIQKTHPENGLLLSVSWDALFDKGLVSFNDDGNLVLSKSLDNDTMQRLGISMTARLPATVLTEERKKNLSWHRKNYGFDT